MPRLVEGKVAVITCHNSASEELFSKAMPMTEITSAERARAIDVLADPAISRAIKTYSDWRTIPQLYLNGAFVGGCDIVQEMHGTGELAELIAGTDAEALS